jgi:hypothetical protein
VSLQIWEIVKSALIYQKDVIDLIRNILVYSLIDETKKHISFTLLIISIPKNQVGVSMCFSKDKLLYNISIFPWTGSR